MIPKWFGNTPFIMKQASQCRQNWWTKWQQRALQSRVYDQWILGSILFGLGVAHANRSLKKQRRHRATSHRSNWFTTTDRLSISQHVLCPHLCRWLCVVLLLLHLYSPFSTRTPMHSLKNVACLIRRRQRNCWTMSIRWAMPKTRWVSTESLGALNPR